jgi:DnaJ-domain-containing protein 1
MEAYIQGKLKLTEQYRAVALTIFHEGLESPLDYREYIEIFRTTFKDRVQLFVTLLDTLLEIGTANGTLDRREEEMIRSIALLLDCSEAYFEKRKQEFLGYH